MLEACSVYICTVKLENETTYENLASRYMHILSFSFFTMNCAIWRFFTSGRAIRINLISLIRSSELYSAIPVLGLVSVSFCSSLFFSLVLVCLHDSHQFDTLLIQNDLYLGVCSGKRHIQPFQQLTLAGFMVQEYWNSTKILDAVILKFKQMSEGYRKEQGQTSMTRLQGKNISGSNELVQVTNYSWR